MMGSMLYLIGGPCTGKSTAINEALGGYVESFDQPIKHLRYAGGYQIGGGRDSFPGTDCLQMNAQPIVMDWLRGLPAGTFVTAEGDRLANHKFFDFVEIELGWDLEILYFAVEPSELRRRRDQRNRNLLAKQDPTWVRGRDTKHERLWRTRFAPFIDNTKPGSATAMLAEHPVIKRIREG